LIPCTIAWSMQGRELTRFPIFGDCDIGPSSILVIFITNGC
jgi:hypothetical protein